MGWTMNPEMRYYQSKPVIVRATQWSGAVEDAHPIIQWVLLGGGMMTWREPGVLLIETLDESLTVSPGDWIVRGVGGEFHACKPGMFKESYLPLGGR